MTQKELKRLSRSELLELLLIQTRENERLLKQLTEAEERITQREMKMEKAGDLAHAVLEVNGVMAAAQAAAQQYLDNIAVMEKKTQERCQAMLEEARREAEQIREHALWEQQNLEMKMKGIYDLLGSLGTER